MKHTFLKTLTLSAALIGMSDVASAVSINCLPGHGYATIKDCKERGYVIAATLDRQFYEASMRGDIPWFNIAGITFSNIIDIDGTVGWGMTGRDITQDDVNKAIPYVQDVLPGMEVTSYFNLDAKHISWTAEPRP